MQRHTDQMCFEYLNHYNESLKEDPSHSWEKTAEYYGETTHTIKGAIKRYKKRMKQTINFIDRDLELSDDIEEEDDEPVLENDFVEPPFSESPFLKDITEDWPEWRDWLKSTPKIKKVAFYYDAHIPQQDPRACNLFCKVTSVFKPDIVVDGGDLHDHETISHWGTTPDKKILDVFDIIGEPTMEFTRNIQAAVGKPFKMPFLPGNHDRWFWKYLLGFPQVAKTLMKDYVRLIKDSGHLWLGIELMELEIGNLTAIHGRSTAKNAADVHLNSWSEEDIISGHIHRIGDVCRTGKNRVRRSITTGCLCQLRPHYTKWQENWQHGMCLALIDTENNKTYFENLVFNDYAVNWGGKLYRA